MQSGIEFDFSYSLAGAPTKKLTKQISDYAGELEKITEQRDWSRSESSILLPLSKPALGDSLFLSRKLPKPSLIIVVGIGGSNLGTMAVYDALDAKLCSEGKKPVPMLFADTVDPLLISSIISNAKSHLEQGKHVVLNVVSKSGQTIETISNFDAIYSALKNFGSLLEVVFTCDQNSVFEKIASDEGFATLPIPLNVGGRYSVFSNAGIFPLALAGIDVNSLLEGANSMLKKSLSKNIHSNPSALAALFLYQNAKEGRNIHVDMMFSPRFHSLGLWHRQLLAESIGKEKNEKGKIVHSGITPAVAIGTTDLHSMAQLYLGGPDDKTYRFCSIGSFGQDFMLGSTSLVSKLSPEIRQKKMSHIMNSICEGTRLSFKKCGRPSISVRLPSLNEYNIGQLMQEEMVETMFLANLIGINAFDQPAVEKYKTEARKLILGK